MGQQKRIDLRILIIIFSCFFVNLSANSKLEVSTKLECSNHFLQKNNKAFQQSIASKIANIPIAKGLLDNAPTLLLAYQKELTAIQSLSTVDNMASCALTNPFPGFPIDFLNDNTGWIDYTLDNMTIVGNGDGTMTILGDIIDGTPIDFGSGSNGTSCGASDSWSVEITLSDRKTYTEWQATTTTAGAGQAKVHADCAGTVENDLDYWAISGTLIGTGCNVGRTLNVTGAKAPYRLQIGFGGNDGDNTCAFSLSTWIDIYENGNPINADIYAFIDETCYNDAIKGLNIKTTYSDNCMGDHISGYTADWNVGIEAFGEADAAISYQRNSDAIQSHTLTGTTDTLTIAGIPADGGVSDTLKVWLTNDTTCGDTIILKRPTPCPVTTTFCEVVDDGDMEAGNFPGGGTPDAFAGGTRVNFEDQTPDSWIAATDTNFGENYWVESSAAYRGNKYLYTFSSGTTDDETDACNQYDISGLPGGTSIQICVYAADANADGNSSGLAIEIEESPSNSFHYSTLEVADNPAWDDNALTSIPWQQYCYTFTTQASTNSGKIWISASTQAGTAVTSYLVMDDMSVCTSGGTEIPSGEICSTVGSNEIKGTVFEDWNYDGIMNQSDTIGVQGVQVDLYDDCGNIDQTTYTDSNGNYEFSGLTGGTTYRIEFSLPESVSCWAKPTKAGADNGTMVQFVQPGNCASLGLASPGDYCQENPLLATPCYVSGDPTAGGTSGASDWWVSFFYNSSGEIGEASYTPPQDHIDGTLIGTTWGSAYHRVTQHFLVGATMKRHSGFGVNGTGAIYKVDATGTPSLFVDLNTLAGIDTGTDTRDGSSNNSLPASSTDLSRDIDAFQAVGKVGLGDLELSDDGQTLYAINLHQRTLIEMAVGNNLITPTAVNSYDIAAATEQLVGGTTIACGSTQDYRPWGLKFHKGILYIGVVCSAESTQTANDLQAYILSFNPAQPTNGFSLVLNLAMDYAREPAFQSDNAAQTIAGTWRPWALEYNDATILPWRGAAHPSPILADIEIDLDGSFILGFLDRFGMQSGYRQFQTDLSDTNADHQGLSAGDVIRFCNVNGNLVQEGQAGCPYNVSPPWTDPGTFVPQGEFYASEEFFTNITSPAHGHPETSMGSLALLYGTGELAATNIDLFTLRSGGIAWWSNTDGSTSKEYELYEAIDQSTPDGTFSKAVGLGDIELGCKVAPLEIGNYVWEDTDLDGLQDACENGIAAVTVELVKGGSVIAATQTDANGQYFFSDKNSTDPTLTWSGTGADTALIANTVYTIRISNAEGGSQQAALDGFALTTTDVNSNNSDNIDNDASIVSTTNAEITATTGEYGCIDHSFDFGFKPQKVAIGNFVFLDNDLEGNYTAGDAAIANVVIQLFHGDSAFTSVPLAVDSTDINGYYYFDQLEPGDYKLLIPDSQFDAGEPLENLQTTTGTGGDNTTDDDDNGRYIGVTTGRGVGSHVINLSPNEEPINEAGQGAGMYPGILRDSSVNETIDFGFIESVAIGNLVYNDLNCNGIFDAGDVGIDSLELRLYKEGAFLPKPEQTVTTDADGYYAFENVAPGRYFVGILSSSFNAGQPLEGLMSVQGASDDETIDDNDDSNGRLNTSFFNMITSGIIDVKPGEEPTNETGFSKYTGTIPDENVNLTVDFAFVDSTTCFSCPELAINAAPNEICAGDSTTLTINFDSIAGNIALYYSTTLFDSIAINSSGHGGATFIDSTTTGVVINEVDYIGGESVELWNTSCETVDVSNWSFCYKFGYNDLNTATISSGDLILSPGEKVAFSNLPNITMNDSSGSLGLYKNNSDFGDPANMVDYVQWRAGGQARESVAVAKGIWTAGDFVAAITSGNTIQYDGYGDRSADWGEGAPTLGNTNVNTDSPLTATFDSGALANATNSPITYYFYAILTDENCNRTAECQPVAVDSVVVNPIPEMTTTDADICEGLSVNLDTLVTNVNNTVNVDTAYFMTMQDAVDSTNAIASLVSPTTSTTYFVRLSTNTNPSCYVVENLTITVSQIIVSISTTCDDNGTGGDANDDTFTITVNATNASPGSSGQYLVIYDGMTLNGSGTAYGMAVTVNHADFVANGSFSPPLTIRDVDNMGCEEMVIVAAVASCSTCPPEICLPVKTMIKRGGGTN